MRIFIFTGLSASGKSTLSKELATELNIPRIDLHQIIHKNAHCNGYDRGREWIGSVGLTTALSISRTDLLSEIDNLGDQQDIVIDEVLDPVTLKTMRDQHPGDDINIIYIKTNRHDRNHFMRKRLGADDLKAQSDAKKERDFIRLVVF